MATEIRPDPEDTLCPACLTPLVLRADRSRDCPKCDYREGVDPREPLPSEAQQEKTLIRDERMRAARARLGDLAAGSESPAQARARIEVSDPLWLKQWEKSDEADVPLASERFRTPNRATSDMNARRGTVRADADVAGRRADTGAEPLGAAQAPHARETHPAATAFTARAQDLRLTEPELDAVERASLAARYGVQIDTTGHGRPPTPPREQATTPEVPERAARARAEGHVDPDEVPAERPKRADTAEPRREPPKKG